MAVAAAPVVSMVRLIESIIGALPVYYDNRPSLRSAGPRRWTDSSMASQNSTGPVTTVDAMADGSPATAEGESRFSPTTGGPGDIAGSSGHAEPELAVLDAVRLMAAAALLADHGKRHLQRIEILDRGLGLAHGLAEACRVLREASFVFPDFCGGGVIAVRLET